jgi:hypothetical protein
MVVKINRYSPSGYYKLKPWIVQAALERLGNRRLTVEEQQLVIEATQFPDKVQWPEWWCATP